MEILKIKPSFSEKIWGGDKLKKMGFNIPNDKKIGEAWIISAHENGMGYIENGEFANQTLKEVFKNNRNLFSNYEGEYPLLVKILTPNDYLSVQVHPTDEYALKKHNSLGKPESWYILDCPKDAKLIYGHNAKSEAELRDMVSKGQWNQLLKEVSIKPGDFLYVEPGKIHAVTPNVVVYELQRSSDITYRFYDYDRVDDKGQTRQLDIEDSISCTSIPDSKDFFINDAKEMIFSSEFFSLYLLDSSKESEFKIKEEPYWLQFSVISGSGKINDVEIKSGESAISIDGIEKITITGDLKVLISWIRK